MREYSLVIYGASGFTGSLAARYVAKQYPDLKWAIAGRSEAKLEKLKSELGCEPGIIIADGNDDDALTKLAESTDAVATCAGLDFSANVILRCSTLFSDHRLCRAFSKL